MSIETGAPSDLLAAHPETAYFWGRVAADGECEDDCVTVRTSDETAARRLAAIAGAERADHRIVERAYAHDTSITRTEDEYTVQVLGGLADRASAALGLPFDGAAGGYRFDTLAAHGRQLLRGLLEGCGTVCFKSDDAAVGVSFVHEDERLLRTVQSLLDSAPVDAPYDGLADASSGYWFGVDDDAVPALADWLYEGSENTGLFAPSRRRKLRKSVERVR
ncbi:cobalamin biosynthesis protein [Halomicroarcula sp. F13]|uniref:Cobalamin biosynthesis protein n=1 Tax=Haloarcula rubra TaxID=2487747 RepID=A0AAW4PSQ2_9EURY|nr:cobalamin biosynthesis protein [Halomicroarcula rubra]MBX0324250.1 cobalamin biosynthesis protein [Halomicroarcula rubra]